jgi:hypothetical protein
VAPSASVCSLRAIPALAGASSLASFALRFSNGAAQGPGVEFHQVEGLEDGVSRATAVVECVEDGDAVGDHRPPPRVNDWARNLEAVTAIRDSEQSSHSRGG